MSKDKTRAELQEDKAREIITLLDGFTFTEQVSSLIGVMLSYIVANMTPEAGEQVVANIAGMLPRQYMEAVALLKAQAQLDNVLSASV